MAKKPFADIPGNKKFDAGLRDLGSLARKLAQEATVKASNAPNEQVRAAFGRMAAALELQAKAAAEVRHILWEAVV